MYAFSSIATSPSDAAASVLKQPSYAGVAHGDVTPIPVPNEAMQNIFAASPRPVADAGPHFVNLNIDKYEGVNNAEVLMDGCCYALACLQKFDPTIQLQCMMDNVDLEPLSIADQSKRFPTDPAIMQAFYHMD